MCLLSPTLGLLEEKRRWQGKKAGGGPALPRAAALWGGGRSLAPGLPASAPRPLREASPGRSPSSRSPGPRASAVSSPGCGPCRLGAPSTERGAAFTGRRPRIRERQALRRSAHTRLLQAARLRGQALKEGDRLPRLVHSSQLRGRKGAGLPWLSGAGHRGPTDGPRPQRPRWFSAAGPHAVSQTDAKLIV